MFKMIKGYGDTSIDVKFNGKIEFIIESIINRRLRDNLSQDKVFYILNKYLDSKGDIFKSKLFDLITEAKNVILYEASKPRINPMPISMVHDILDMFDFDDVREFIVKEGIIRAPSTLPDKFDNLIVEDEKGSREQTYLKDDYTDLIALITIMKSTLPIIGEYATIKDGLVGKTQYKEFVLLRFFLTHKISKLGPFVKLHDSIKKLINRLFSDERNTSVRIIERGVSKENLLDMLLALIIVEKILVNDELSDNDVKNTVTKIYSYASNKLKLKDNSSTIRLKAHSDGPANDNQENESILESYRTPSDITIGDIEKFKFTFQDPVQLADWIGLKRTRKDIYNTKSDISELIVKMPIEESVFITSWLFKEIEDPRSFKHLEIEEIINAITVAYLWLWDNGHKELAMLITSFSNKVDVVKLNFSLRNKIDLKLREELIEVYPYNKRIISNGVSKSSSLIEDTVATMSKSVMGYNLVTTAPEEDIISYSGNKSREFKVPEGIRNLLVKYLVDINRRVVKNDKYL